MRSQQRDRRMVTPSAAKSTRERQRRCVSRALARDRHGSSLEASSACRLTRIASAPLCGRIEEVALLLALGRPVHRRALGQIVTGRMHGVTRRVLAWNAAKRKIPLSGSSDVSAEP